MRGHLAYFHSKRPDIKYTFKVMSHTVSCPIECAWMVDRNSLAVAKNARARYTEMRSTGLRCVSAHQAQKQLSTLYRTITLFAFQGVPGRPLASIFDRAGGHGQMVRPLQWYPLLLRLMTAVHRICSLCICSPCVKRQNHAFAIHGGVSRMCF